jgi:hypothetical protein
VALAIVRPLTWGTDIKKSRVEAQTPAPIDARHRWGGRSQWCDRLPLWRSTAGRGVGEGRIDSFRIMDEGIAPWGEDGLA